MRTLLTTTGKVDDIEDASIGRCFINAHKDGFWLDIEEPDADDYKLLQQTFKFHPLTIRDIQHQNELPKNNDYRESHCAASSQTDHGPDAPPHHHTHRPARP